MPTVYVSWNGLLIIFVFLGRVWLNKTQFANTRATLVTVVRLGGSHYIMSILYARESCSQICS